jgi:hypothetical protein
MLSNPLNQDRLVELPIFFFYIEMFLGPADSFPTD